MGEYGDVVTFGTRDNPAIDQTSGFAIPWEKPFILTPPAD